MYEIIFNSICNLFFVVFGTNTSTADVQNWFSALAFPPLQALARAFHENVWKQKNWLLSAHFSWEHYRTHKLKGVFIFVYSKDRSTLPRECVHCWLNADWYHTTRRGWLLELLPRTSSISTFDNRAALLEADAFSTNRISSAVFASPLFFMAFNCGSFLWLLLGRVVSWISEFVLKCVPKIELEV